MTDLTRNRISKFLSYVLRHHPEAVGLQLDENGWVSLNLLVDACNAKGQEMTRGQVIDVVNTSEKKRFALSEDGQRIRASQGHSVEVDLAYEEKAPPMVLYHGTVAKFLQPIQAEGLKKMARHHVHLSEDVETAERVGMRRGRPVVLRVDADEMAAAGHRFYQSANGVWLTEHVPAKYIGFPDGATWVYLHEIRNDEQTAHG